MRINRHKLETIPPALHAKIYRVNANGFDLQLFLRSRLKARFEKIEMAVDLIESQQNGSQDEGDVADSSSSFLTHVKPEVSALVQSSSSSLLCCLLFRDSKFGLCDVFHFSFVMCPQSDLWPRRS